jgi:diguanylate cyclase (GGDEF)-like protein/PAS domain S-box-containing protein
MKTTNNPNQLSHDLLDEIFHINPEPMTLTRIDTGQYIAVNESFLKTFGYTHDEVIGHTAQELGIWENPERDRPRVIDQIREHGHVSDIDVGFLTKSGETIRFNLGATLIEWDDGPLLLITGRNITALRKSEAALRASEARFRGLIENLPIGVLIAQDGLIRYANPSSLKMIDYRLDEILGRPFSHMVHEEDREYAMEFHDRRMRGDNSRLSYDLRVVRKGGAINSWRIHTQPDMWDGNVASLVVCTDITEQKLAEQRLTDLALHDQVTGLANRMLLTEHVHQTMAHISKGFALLYMDLDGFKAVNDCCGHATGDQVLREVADRLSHSIRDTDMAARIGGDEFVIVILNIDNYSMARQVAENIRLALNHPIHASATPHHLGVSIGIALFPADGENLDTLISHADEAMYRAKRGGRNRVCCYASDPRP